MSRLFTVSEVSHQLGVDSERVHSFVDREWIRPAGCECQSEDACAAGPGEGQGHAHEHYLDDCDLARVRLILELGDSFGANDESIPIILHLIDQIHFLRERLLQARPGPVGRA